MFLTRACPAPGLTTPRTAPRPLRRIAPPYAASSGLCGPRSSGRPSSSRVRAQVGPSAVAGGGDAPGASRREDRMLELMTAAFAAAAKAQQASSGLRTDLSYLTLLRAVLAVAVQGAELAELAARVQVLEAAAMQQQASAHELGLRVRELEAREAAVQAAAADAYPQAAVAAREQLEPAKVQQFGYTALLYASEVGATQMVEALLRAGADVAVEDKAGQTALHVASQGGHTEAVEALVRAGADMDAKDGEGQTALHRASQEGNTEVVEALLRAGADAEAKDDAGQTALHLACNEGHTEAVEALLQAGADRRAKDNGLRVRELEAREAAVQAAAADAYPQAAVAAREQLEPAKVQQDKHAKRMDLAVRYAESEDEIALVGAARDSDLPEVERLLSKPAINPNVQARDWEGQTALHAASQWGNTEVVEALLQAGADAEAKDDAGQTALHLACNEGHTEAVEALLHAGADRRAKDNDSQTPLHLASQEGHVEVMKALLRAVADTAAEDEDEDEDDEDLTDDEEEERPAQA
ncbi:Ankyrin repeat domain-containing protein 50 [Tetrabaena socialis]|uniref:Ankyrin repeat domain-containing protein 50 n=1 Tax=Tetrabaena socialis TaxID=47790 RepID=A0A2J8A296_9CHLO|nr:Ankyrin repeat domain-containing protein 50 [Tetrabaena socialis]|eukprot:PNH06640.1 Ankyrin repeat domain-containing protein 50 [Tetrabaena socialis]